MEEMNLMEALKQESLAMSEEMPPEEVMQLKRIANGGAVILLEAMEKYIQYMNEYMDIMNANDGKNRGIVMAELFESLFKGLGGSDQAMEFLSATLEASSKLVMKESEEMDEEP